MIVGRLLTAACASSVVLENLDQPTTAPKVDEDELCEGIVTGWANRPALHLTSRTEYRAYYRPSADSVHMPARNRFVDAPRRTRLAVVITENIEKSN